MTNKLNILILKDGEKWYQSRRVWGAVLSLTACIATIFFPIIALKIVPVITLIASTLGIKSFIAPK